MPFVDTFFFVDLDAHESGPWVLANGLALGKGGHDGHESGPYMLANGLALGKGAHDGHESGPYMLANALALENTHMLALGLAMGKGGGGGVGQSWKILAAIGSKQASYSQGRCRPQLLNQANAQTESISLMCGSPQKRHSNTSEQVAKNI